MDPVCFHIGSKPIYWYGVMVAGGFLAGILHWTRVLKREGRPQEFASDLAVWLMVGSVIGARLVYVFANPADYLAHPLSILRVDQGGLIFYGGLIGGSVSVILLAWRRHEPLWRLADFTVTALPLGHAFGRVGCFLNGCCYGSACDLPWAVYSNGAMRHPTQLYEAGLNLLLYGALAWYYPRRRRDGDVLALYLIAYSVLRFLLEFVRGDERQPLFGLDVAQGISLVLLACGVALWTRKRAPEIAAGAVR